MLEHLHGGNFGALKPGENIVIELTVYADHAMIDDNRIPIAEYRELVIQHNVNLYCSEDAEIWFDEDTDTELTIMSDTEFFETYCY